jgi:hypothetical protein
MEAKKDNIWLERARDAFTSSTTYFDANIRRQIEQDIRQATNRFPLGSKYLSEAYRSRSKIFRPKTRTAIRKNEAVAAAAFFSTEDVVNIAPQDDSDPTQLASASVMKELMQYRLKKSIPWFQICIGAYQDAQTVGVVASKQYWDYRPGKKIDRPCIDLIPVENVRIDPSAKWQDPIGTSPYVILMMPMYVKDVMARMKQNQDGKTRWKPLTKAEIQSAGKSSVDSTRLAREDQRTDSTDNSTNITEFSIVWVHENFMSIDGEDVVYYTLGTEFMLTDPEPIENVYFHGKNPIVMGCAVIETHKIYSASLPGLTHQQQTEINEVANQRIDNVKFAMNKRYFVQRGQQVDLRSLTRNVPSSVTLMNNPNTDVKVIDTPDVTSSAYAEQDRLNLDFDDAAGTFSQSSVQSNRNLNETVGGMEMLSSGSNQMSEYMLRTFSETWVEPVLRQLVLLEQYYETDETVLAIAGKKAQIAKKFGMDAVTDEMLMQEFTLNVNVGLGATNPQIQVDRFLTGMRFLVEMLGPSITQRINVEEVVTELFGKLGYKDGKRFFNWDGDAKYSQLIDMVTELQAQVEQKDNPELIKAQIDKINAEISDIKAGAVKKGVEGAYAAMQAARVIATTPQVAPVADEIMAGAGYEDKGGQDPNFPTPQIPVSAVPPINQNTTPYLPPVPESALAGVETQAYDG